jgi:hypothetical protein
MTLVVTGIVVALRETPDDRALHPAGTVMRNDPVEKVADADVPNWIKVRVLGSNPPREGFIHTSDVIEQQTDAKIPEDRFIATVSVAARSEASNALYLYALAFAESEITNAGPAAGSKAVGPFQFTTQRWSELIQRYSTAAGLSQDDRLDPYQQITMAAIASGAAIKSLTNLLGREPQANELYLVHILGDADGSAVLMTAKDHPDTAIDATMQSPLSEAAATIISGRPKLFRKDNRPATIAEALEAAAAALQPGLDKALALKDRLAPPDTTASPSDTQAGPVAEGALAWGAKVSSVFRDKVRRIASGLGTNPNYLMASMAFETGRTFSPSKRNPASSATGLIQFMSSTAEGLGTSTAALAAMTAEAQLDYVEKYFSSKKGQLHNLGDVYMMILYPSAVGQPDDFVLFSPEKSLDAYNANKGLDVDGDGKVTRLEATTKVAAALTEGLLLGYVG